MKLEYRWIIGDKGAWLLAEGDNLDKAVDAVFKATNADKVTITYYDDGAKIQYRLAKHG